MKFQRLETLAVTFDKNNGTPLLKHAVYFTLGNSSSPIKLADELEELKDERTFREFLSDRRLYATREDYERFYGKASSLQ